MKEVAVAAKPRVLLVGGMAYNVPAELNELFDIVKHIEQGTRKCHDLPAVDYVFVISDWASHNVVETVKREVKAQVVWLRKGWGQMKEDLVRRSILPPDPPAAPEAPAAAPQEASPTTTGLPEKEMWKRYKEKLIEAAQTVLIPKERVPEDELLEALAMGGLPKEDCRTLLPRLQMAGIVDPCGDGKWRLMVAKGGEYEREDAAKEEGAKEKAEPAERPRRRTKVVEDILRKMHGLRFGPYTSKKALTEEMRKYREFAGFSDHTLYRYIDRAIALHIVDDTHSNIFIDHRDDEALTPVREGPAPEPEIPAELEAPPPAPPPAPAAPKGMGKVEAETAWCRVVEDVRKERGRVADVLQHCRIEWLPGNDVLCVLVPTVLSAFQKVLEATDNWGCILRVAHGHFSASTVVRIMPDNGLKG